MSHVGSPAPSLVVLHPGAPQRHSQILDIYSRYAVGWMLATRESAVLAEKLIADTCSKQGIGRDQLTLHADRGSSMTSKPVAFLLADLGITQSHSRPHVSNDNPFSDYAEGVVMPSTGRGVRVRAGRGAAVT
jgi:hypothetical protein